MKLSPFLLLGGKISVALDLVLRIKKTKAVIELEMS